MEFRLVRLGASLGFFASVILMMFEFITGSPWSWVGGLLGAVFFGPTMLFLWKDEAFAIAEARSEQTTRRPPPPGMERPAPSTAADREVEF